MKTVHVGLVKDGNPSMPESVPIESNNLNNSIEITLPYNLRKQRVPQKAVSAVQFPSV